MVSSSSASGRQTNKQTSANFISCWIIHNPADEIIEYRSISLQRSMPSTKAQGWRYHAGDIVTLHSYTTALFTDTGIEEVITAVFAQPVCMFLVEILPRTEPFLNGVVFFRYYPHSSRLSLCITFSGKIQCIFQEVHLGTCRSAHTHRRIPNGCP